MWFFRNNKHDYLVISPIRANNQPHEWEGVQTFPFMGLISVGSKGVATFVRLLRPVGEMVYSALPSEPSTLVILCL